MVREAEGTCTVVTIFLGEDLPGPALFERAAHACAEDEMDAAVDFSPEPQFIG